MKISITKHGMEQLMSRMHVNKTEAYRITQRAWTSGMKIDEYFGGLRESLTRSYIEHDENTSLRLYKGMRFVFSRDGALITVYQDNRVPSKGDRRAYRYKYNHHAIKEFEIYCPEEAYIVC